MIESLEFHLIACVLHRSDYRADYGDHAMDPSLPNHLYMMMMDFLMERVAIALETQFGGMKAEVVAEGRGAKEDALLQYEYARLHLEGTSYISPAWFRHALTPGITFEGKDSNDSGLQLADLAARPCGEKVIDPTSTPDRWPQFRDKLCPGKETQHSILGIKIVPWTERYEGLWKS